MTRISLAEKLKKAALKGASIPLKLLPNWVEAIGAGAFISTIIESKPAFKGRLKELEGKVFLFEATDHKKTFYMIISNGDIRIALHHAGAPDVSMRGEVEVLVGLLLGKVDPDTVFFSRRLEITGDTAVAILFKNILAAI